MSAAEDDARFMEEAIRLGLLHLGQTSTNPSVGCVHRARRRDRRPRQ